MDAASTGRQVRRLEELGFADRVPDETDARVVIVEITPSGQRRAAAHRRVLEAHLRDALDRWSPADRRRLGELLQRLVDDFRDIQFRNPTHDPTATRSTA